MTEMTMPKFEPVGYLDADGYYLYTNTSRRDIAPLYTADQLTEAYEAGKQDQAAELEAARAEIERLENQVQARDAELWGRTQKILQLEQQLAAEQAYFKEFSGAIRALPGVTLDDLK